MAWTSLCLLSPKVCWLVDQLCEIFPAQDNLQLFCDICRLGSSEQIFAVMFSKKYILSSSPATFLQRGQGTLCEWWVTSVILSLSISTEGVDWPGGRSAGNVSPLAQNPQSQLRVVLQFPPKDSVVSISSLCK